MITLLWNNERIEFFKIFVRHPHEYVKNSTLNSKDNWENFSVLKVGTKNSVFTRNPDLAFQVRPESGDRPIVLYLWHIAVELIHVYFAETLQ